MGEWGHALLGVAMSTALIWVMVYVPVRLARWVEARDRHRPYISAASLHWPTLLSAAASGSAHDSCGHAPDTGCGSHGGGQP